jgi:flagellar biogenesis protein FliO
VLVIILAYVCMLALKKFSQRRMAGSGKGMGLRVVDTIGLAPNRQLHIVTLGERAFLIGSTPESVSLISDISQAPGAPGSPRDPHVEADPAFARRIKELMKVAPAGRGTQAETGAGHRLAVGHRLAQAAQFIKARSNQLRPLGEIIDETVSG